MMKYQLKDFNRNVPDIELLDDMKLIAAKLGVDKLSSRDYDTNSGKFTAGTIGVRFGSWNNALAKAGLKLILKHNPSDLVYCQIDLRCGYDDHILCKKSLLVLQLQILEFPYQYVEASQVQGSLLGYLKNYGP